MWTSFLPVAGTPRGHGQNKHRVGRARHQVVVGTLSFRGSCTSRSLSTSMSIMIPAIPCWGRSLETVTGSCCQVWSTYGSVVLGFSSETAPQSEYQVPTFPFRASQILNFWDTLSKFFYFIYVNNHAYLISVHSARVKPCVLCCVLCLDVATRVSQVLNETR